VAIVGTAYVVVNANTTNVSRQIRAAVQGAQSGVAADSDRLGRTISNGMLRGARSFSTFETQARAANDAFFRLVTTGYAIGPAIAGAVGGISALVSGLFALTAQASAALPSLIVLPSLFAALAQGAIATKVAFGGVGAALAALGKGAKKSGKDKEAALKRITEAEQGLARVIERNRETLVRAAKAVTDAENRLTEARKRASESLQQLNFDAEDAAISEQRAAIVLEKARETLTRVQDLPPNSAARREAELAFAEADLNYRRAIDRNKDLAKETEEANAKGVEGSDEVIDASERLRDAKDEQARAERDALRAQLDAIEALEDAKKALDDLGKSASGAKDPLADLSKEAREFVLYLFSLRGEIKKLRVAAGQEIFPKLTVAIDAFVTKLFPRLIPILRESASAIGDVALSFARVLTKARQLDSIDRIAAQNATTIRRLGAAGTNLAVIFIDLLDAARPLIDRFTKWIVTLTSGWRESIKTRKATGSLTETFKKAGDVAAQLGRIFSNIASALFDVGKEAAGPGSGGQKLLDAFEGATEKFQAFVKEVSKDGKLEKFFNDVGDNVIKIGQLVVKIADVFLRLGDDEGVGGFADSLKPAVENIGKILTALTDGGPALGTFISKLTELILIFTETGSIKTFFGILTSALDTMIRVFSDPRVMNILMIAAPIIGALKAFTLLTKVGSFAFKVIAGYAFKLFGALRMVLGPVLTLAQSLGMLFTGGVGTGFAATAGIFAGLLSIVAILVGAYAYSEKFREAIAKLGRELWDRLIKAFNTVKDAVKEVFMGGSEGAISFKDILAGIGDVLAVIVPIIGTVLKTAIDAAAQGFRGIIYAVGFVINVFKAIVKVVQAVVALFQGDWKKAGKLFGEAWDAIKAAVKFAVKAIVAYIKYLWTFFKLIPKLMWEAMKLAWKLIVGVVKGAIRMIVAIIKALPKLAGKFFMFLWDTFRDLTKALIPWFGDRMSDLLDFVKSIPGKVGRFLAKVWDKFKDGVVALKNWFGERLSDMVDYVKTLPGRFWRGLKNIWKNLQDATRKVASWLKDRFNDLVDFFKELPGRVWNGIKNIWNKLVESSDKVERYIADRFNDIVAFIKGIPRRIAEFAATMWDGIKSGVRTLKTFVGDRIDDIVEFVTGLPGKIAAVASGIWEPLKSGFQSVIGGIIGAWNALDLGFHITIPDWFKYIPGLSSIAGKKFGFDDLFPDVPNPFGDSSGGTSAPRTLTRFAKGGVVQPVPGGILAQIAEAGKPERIEPLDPDGLSKRDKAMIKMLAGQGPVTMNIYPSPGMDERELARMVDYRLAQRFRAGGTL
jgi:phage-related protein